MFRITHKNYICLREVKKDEAEERAQVACDRAYLEEVIPMISKATRLYNGDFVRSSAWTEMKWRSRMKFTC